jgi:hypothetical protein
MSLLACTHDFRPNKLTLNFLNINIHTNNRTCVDLDAEHVNTETEDADISNLLASELTTTSRGKHYTNKGSHIDHYTYNLKLVYFPHFHSIIRYRIPSWKNSTDISEEFYMQNKIITKTAGAKRKSLVAKHSDSSIFFHSPVKM